MKEQIKGNLVPCLAITILGILEAIALLRGINGVLFSAISITIAGIAGYKLKNVKAGIKNE